MVPTTQGKDQDIKKELESVAGRLEWATDHGVGISFLPDTTDDVFAHIPTTIVAAVWINLENTKVTNSGLAQLEGAPVLESVRIAGTDITATGIEHLLRATPSIQAITISRGQLAPGQLQRILCQWPRVRICEV